MGFNTPEGEMMIILALLASYGLTAILIESQLFNWFRWTLGKCGVPKLGKCYRCMGFWVGLVVGCVGFSGVACVLFPFAASGFSYGVHRLISLLSSPPPPPMQEAKPERSKE